MKLGELSLEDLEARLKAGELFLRIGPFLCHVQASIPGFSESLHLLYAYHHCEAEVPFADFHVTLQAPRSPRRWIRPQVGFYMDGRSPFKPLPQDQVFPLFEWGLNWCISSTFNQYLIFHAAALERNNRVIVMPGSPGAGKSTLTAAMAFNGWRLFSDELTLLSTTTGEIVPVTKTVSLKNESINVIREFVPGATLGTTAHDTTKGSVAHIRPPADSVARATESASAAWLVFPRYKSGSSTELTALPKAQALVRLVSNAFNYTALGLPGFQAAASLVDQSQCFDFRYSDLDDGLATMRELASS